jgi:peptidoglycan/LPS O-acetylase OafA/YrhL
MQGSIGGNPGEKWKRLEGVDLLRGLAIFFVLMNHVNMRLRLAKVPYTVGIPQALVQGLVWNGQQGVQIFFAVSGFLIASTSLRRWGGVDSGRRTANVDANVDIAGFYRLRFARIAPLLILLLAILTSLHFAGFQDYIVTAQRGGFRSALLAALTFRVNVQEANHGYLPANWDILWSLSIEETFYFFFPLLCRLFGRGKLLVAILLGFVAAGPFSRALSHGVWQEYSYWGGMDAIALGCLTALALWHGRAPRPRTAVLAGAALMLLILCFAQQVADWGLERTGLSMTILAIGTCLVICAAAQTNWQAPRAFRPLLDLGERSYEVYLTHMFVVFSFFHVFLWAGKQMSLVAPFFIASIVVAGLLGELVARFYSDPMNRFLRAKWRSRRIIGMDEATAERTGDQRIAADIR